MDVERNNPKATGCQEKKGEKGCRENLDNVFGNEGPRCFPRVYDAPHLRKYPLFSKPFLVFLGVIFFLIQGYDAFLF